MAWFLWVTSFPAKMRMTLADGVSVHIDVAAKLKRKTAAKRKYIKKKDAVVEQLTIRLVPPKGKAFSGHQQLSPRMLPGLALKRAQVQPRHATFVYATAPARRAYYRSGWTDLGLGTLINSTMLAGALIHSYKTAARARRGGDQAPANQGGHETGEQMKHEERAP